MQLSHCRLLLILVTGELTNQLRLCCCKRGKKILQTCFGVLWSFCLEASANRFFSPFGRMFDHSFPAYFFFFLMEISSRTLIPLFMPGLVHSGSAIWDDCGRMFRIYTNRKALQHGLHHRIRSDLKMHNLVTLPQFQLWNRNRHPVKKDWRS